MMNDGWWLLDPGCRMMHDGGDGDDGGDDYDYDDDEAYDDYDRR